MIKKALLTAFAGMAASSISLSAIADDDPADTRWYLGALYNFYNADGNWNADGDSPGYTISIGKHLNHHIGIEAAFGHVELERPTQNADLSSMGVNVLYYPLGREYGMYTTAGIGQTDVKSNVAPKFDYTHYDLGIGFVSGMLRGEVKARLADHDNETGLFGDNSSTDYIASLGLMKSFGENTGSTYEFPSYDGEQDKRIYANIGLAYNLADKGLNVEDDAGMGYRVGLGVFLRRTLSAEFHADLNSYDVAGGGELDESNYGIDLLMFKHRNPEFAPFTLIGAGVTELEGSGVKNEGNYVDVGFGFLTSFTSYRLGLRFDVRYRTAHLDKTSQNTHSGIFNLGLNVPFGAPPSPPDDDNDGVANPDDQCPNTPSGTPVDSKGCPLDSDKDGVIDPQDACPNTPAGTEVDARGCPIDKDSDGDGVNDSKDECPGTPEGTAVGPNGCPVDDDGDGVINSADECPDTPAGLEVDGKGCVAAQAAVLKGVNFEFNSAQLTDHAERILDDVAAVWESQPSLAAQVAGHTDWMGPSDYNLQLSQQRAESVKAYLVSKGVPADQLSARGFGESRPVADNETELGRAENRRVELEVE